MRRGTDRGTQKTHRDDRQARRGLEPDVRVPPGQGRPFPSRKPAIHRCADQCRGTTAIRGGTAPLPTVALTDLVCRNAACPPPKTRACLTDGGGLYLAVPSGVEALVLKYYFDGKEKRLALGSYSEAGSANVVVSLKKARDAWDRARLEHRTGVDPVQRWHLDKLTRDAVAGTTFAAIARELHAVKKKGWREKYAARWIERMEKDLFPWIGSLPLAEITAPLLVHTLRRLEDRGAHETARTLRQTAGQLFRYGVATGRCERNPSPDLQGALQPIIVKHMSAVLEPTAAASLLRAIWTYEGQPLRRAALKLSGLTFQRPGSIRHVEWREIDFDSAQWTIPASKMKRSVQTRRAADLIWSRLRHRPSRSCATPGRVGMSSRACSVPSDP